MDFFTTYLEPVITFVVGGGLASVLSARYVRKTAQADAMKAVQDVYQETIQDLRSDKDEMKKENKEMHEQIIILKKTVEQNCKDIQKLQVFKCTVMSCNQRVREE
jgi:uncharacterized protein (UPF0305 family)